MFDSIKELQAIQPDFKVNFIGFENGQARISVGPKEVTSHPLLAENLGRTYTPWDTFYSRIETGPILNSIPNKEISKYSPSTPETIPYSWPDGKLREDGEFVIPLNTEIFFWVLINGSYRKDEQANVTASSIGFWGMQDYNNTREREYIMRVDWGTQVPADLAAKKNPISELWTYGFHLPIFRIIVKNTEVELEMYDCGETVFTSAETEIQANLLNFSKASSYFD